MTLFARYGWQGGRVHCLAGCTSIWLLRRGPGQERILPKRIKQRPLVSVNCRSCRKWFKTKGTNALRCAPCRAELHRLKARLAQQRYSHRIRRAL